MARVTLYFWIGCLMTVTANGYSQVTKFNLNLEDRTIRETMDFIEDNSEFIFLYRNQDLNVTKKVNLHFRNATIQMILDEILANEEVQYSVYEKQIVIFKKIEMQEPLNSKGKIQLPAKEDSGTGNIQGHIRDENGLPLVGASIVIDKTTIGTITDANGNYFLLGAPSGKQLIRISFVGYQEETREITVIKGEVISLSLQMKESKLEILGVVAYGQARGQLSAIQQQINAKGISNVVSAEKLQELPDVNVAEAVGRLPGLMVERNRGEGQKIIIRGLEPKYNTISIGGNMVPSTSTDDRSTDLNMISPEILGGVEVLKANTADREADGLGGTVNLTLKEAPTGLKMNVGILTGVTGQTNSLSNYRVNFYMSNRFFNNKLGIMMTGNVDIAERNSDCMKVSYTVQGTPDYESGETYIKPWIASMDLYANVEDRTRCGGSLLFDLKLGPSSTIKSSNFVGFLNQDINDRTKQYALTGNCINIFQYNTKIDNLILSNSLEGKHFIRSSVLDWGASRSQSTNESPFRHSVNFRKLSAYNGYEQGVSFDIEPPEFVPSPENVNDNIDQYYFYHGRNQPYKSKETESGLFLNCQTPFRIGEFISGNIKTGAKLRVKDRERNNELYVRRLDNASQVNSFIQAFPDWDIILTSEGVTNKLSILNFLDNDYKARDFMDNKYEYLKVDKVLERKLINSIYEKYLKDYYNFIEAAAQNDYETRESVLSYYLMSEVNFGKYITFIPGIRFEKTDIKYMAYIAESIPETQETEFDVEYRDTIATNCYYHILPQIHLKVKPTDWFDVRLAYTNTLSRPNYNQLAPKKIISVNSQTVSLGNTALKPALSHNFDIIFTFYNRKYGLLTLGAFCKDIKDFVWDKEALIIDNTSTGPAKLNVPQSTLGYTVYYPLNNINKSSIKGLEFDIQSNLDFLPVKGLVFNMNYTLMDSKTKYPETLIIRKLNPDYKVVPGAPRIIFVNQDTCYIDRLLSQPSFLANVGLGYDNKRIGLSVRVSFNYQDNILTHEQRRPDGADREGTKAFHRWDFQLNQRITKRMTLNANVANIFNQPDRSVRLITGYLTNIEYYGYLAQVGLKYDLY